MVKGWDGVMRGSRFESQYGQKKLQKKKIALSLCFSSLFSDQIGIEICKWLNMT